MRTQRETHRLCFESLEDRCLLAVYTVSSTANSGAGSLRDAIQQANSHAGPDEIVFAAELSGQTIRVGSQLNINDPLVIDATSLPNGITIDGGRTTRLMWINAGVSVELRDLTFTGSRVPGGEGAVVNYGNLIVTASRFFDNDDVAIWNSGTVTVSHSFFYRNAGLGEHASGLFNQGVAKIFDSTFAENSRGDQFKPPVIETISGSGRGLTIERSTIGGDEKPYDADGQGSSIIDRNFFGTIGPFTPRVVLKNSIVFGNVDAPVQAEYSLLADVDPALVTGTGYLLNVDPQLGPLADNGGRTPTYAVLPSSPALNADDPNFIPSTGQTDQRGGSYQRVVGQLDMGAYEAQALPTTTPGDFNADGRVDAADYSLWRDNLGRSVAPLTAGDATGDGLVDQADYRTWRAHFGFVPIGGQLVVNSLGDRDDGNISNGILTLREAINFSKSVTWGHTITFDPSLSGGVIHVASEGFGYYQIEKQITIDARSLPAGITLDAGRRTTGLHVNAFTVTSGNNFDVTLAGLTIANGISGGAINSAATGTLTLIECNLINSTSAWPGGAIRAEGNVELIDTLIDGALSAGAPSLTNAAVYANGNVSLLRSTIRNVGDDTRRNRGITSVSNGVNIPRTVTLIDSSITNTSLGGVSVSGQVIMERSRIENNQGPGIVAPRTWTGSNYPSGNVTLVDSIVSNNTSLVGLNFEGARAGSGIAAGGQVSLIRSRVENNRVTQVGDVRGGGITAYGRLTAIDSFINGNNADLGGGIWVRGDLPDRPSNPGEVVVTLVGTELNKNESRRGAAALHALGSVSIETSSVSGNKLPSEGITPNPNGIIYQEVTGAGHTLTITDSVLAENSAPLDSFFRLTNFLANYSLNVNTQIIRSEIIDNQMFGVTAARVVDSTVARNSGTGVLGSRLEIIGSTIRDNLASDGAAGANASDTIVVERSLIANNHTTFPFPGVALSSAGGLRANTVILIDSTLRDNTVTGLSAGGGGIRAQAVHAYGSTISGNAAIGEGARGGGVFAPSLFRIRQSTLSGNRAEGTAAQGGGFWGQSVDAVHVTVVDNHALGDSSAGGGIFVEFARTLLGSVVANNTATSAPDLRATVVDPVGTAPGVAYSLIRDTDGSPLATGGGGTGNLLGLDPLLGPLADNGGPTWTHAPLPGSPLIDAGDPTLTAVPFVITTPFSPPINIAGIYDQRGEPYARVVDGGSGTLRIDIGAVEVQSPASLLALDAAFATLP